MKTATMAACLMLTVCFARAESPADSRVARLAAAFDSLPSERVQDLAKAYGDRGNEALAAANFSAKDFELVALGKGFALIDRKAADPASAAVSSGDVLAALRQAHGRSSYPLERARLTEGGRRVSRFIGQNLTPHFDKR